MVEFTTPPSYGSSVVNVGGIVMDGELLFAGSSNSAAHTEVRDDPDWPEPGAVKYIWSGKTKDGKTASAELSGGLGKRLDKVDVLAEVPGFVKTIVGGLVGLVMESISRSSIQASDISIEPDPSSSSTDRSHN